MTVYTHRRMPLWISLLCAPFWLGFSVIALLGALAAMSFTILVWVGKTLGEGCQIIVARHREGSA